MDDKPKKWLTLREVRQIEQGQCPNLDQIDVRAILEARAEQLMRGFSRRSPWWELEEE